MLFAVRRGFTACQIPLVTSPKWQDLSFFPCICQQEPVDLRDTIQPFLKLVKSCWGDDTKDLCEPSDNICASPKTITVPHSCFMMYKYDNLSKLELEKGNLTSLHLKSVCICSSNLSFEEKKKKTHTQGV